ncbi:MAG: hypothetical protein II928_01845 [Paludibacteraceae bacterium]|nr:hypothetical protein [Paludibacteraceae bacterium]
MSTSLPANSPEMLQIVKRVESRFGSHPDSPADFAELSLRIKLDIGKEISPDTLSRIWGYKKGYSSVRRTTVEILDAYGKADTDSDFVYGMAIRAEEMPVGGMVRIFWLPDRFALLEYKGDFRWEVLQVGNSKLREGDTFSCRIIAEGQPMIIDNLKTADRVYKGYIIGGKNGLAMVKKIIGGY